MMYCLNSKTLCWTQTIAAFATVCLVLLVNPQAKAITNDDLGVPIIISTPNYTNLQSTAEATSFDPVPPCVSGFGSGVWYQFTPDRNGEVVIDTIGSDFDTGLALYTGYYYALNFLACDDD